jgi:2-oxoglutarate ferredoxin oxidoreductase subunit alpha
MVNSKWRYNQAPRPCPSRSLKIENRKKQTENRSLALLDGSRLITESLARTGADAYIGYPITPASLIYSYASRRFPVILPAPDEITALQWMTGLSATGHLPVSATSFPGLALMVESINMAYMMELPMVIVLVQRMGPSTGTATAGAQGDLQLLHGLISGGYPLPVFSISDMSDCWQLPPVALKTAVDLRTPVILLTSKEMVVTERSFDLAQLEPIEPLTRTFYDGDAPYRPYAVDGGGVPPFLPLGDDRHQVRLTASTHDPRGLLQHSTDDSLANTRRLATKVRANVPVLYDLDEQANATTLVITYGITTGAAREAVAKRRARGHATSLLVTQTLLPVPDTYYEFLERYLHIVIAEENLEGQLARLLYGQRLPSNVDVVTRIGHMIEPEQITRVIEVVESKL